MKKSVRFLALALSAAMLFGLTACGGGKDDSQPQEAPGTEESGAAEDAGAENADASNPDATVLQLGTTVNEQDSFQVAAEKFAELVEERTNGAYKIEIYPNGTLGGERDMLESMQMDTLDMAIVTSGPFINFSDAMGVLDMPYLFGSNEEAYTLLD